MIGRGSFMYLQSVVRLSFPSIISLKLKEPCASQNDDGDCVKRRMVMKKSGSLTESLLDSLVSFVFVVTCVDPKTTTSIYRCT